MAIKIISDWSACNVALGPGRSRDVEYRVYQEKGSNFQEIRDVGGEHIHTLKLPEGLLMERQSYEVLLRYVLLDVEAA